MMPPMNRTTPSCVTFSHQEAAAGDEDLLDVAATYTLLRRGTVYAVASEHMPADTPAAAILRY
jgi:hypothetical protein